MVFNTREISNESGEPVALYEFRYGNTYWRYTTADQDIPLGLDEGGVDTAIWVAKAISDEGVTQGGSDQNGLKIEVPVDLPVAALFRNTQPSQRVWLSVRRWHYGDPDTEMPLQWQGTVTNSIQLDEATSQLNCMSIAGTYDRNGLRLAWGLMCPHFLYGHGCKVDKSLHAYPKEIATLSSTGFTVVDHEEPAEGSFSGGFLEWEVADGSFERRAIEVQDGNDFTVLGITDGMSVGDNVILYPGCARTTTICKLFGNLANYGGFPHLPGKSPFDGEPVF